MKSGAILCNSGHFNVEIDLDALGTDGARSRQEARAFVEEFSMQDGRQASTCWAKAG